jgi:AcrR family transcriptional regulator
MPSSPAANLRERQTAATREQILDVAFEMLTRHPNDPFSHEAVARKAGMGARTVYRYFPSRAELLQAVWERLRGTTQIRFPTAEDEIVPFIRDMFQQFENNETLVRAMIDSPLGREVRARGSVKSRAELTRSLSKILPGLTARRQSQVVGLFLSLYSGNFWQALRDRGGLSAADAQEAAVWAMQALLDAARREAISIPKSKETR